VHAVKEARISVERLVVAIFLLFEWAMKSGARHMVRLGATSWGPPSEVHTLYPLMAKENSML
jgi:hypothetical protein